MRARDREDAAERVALVRGDVAGQQRADGVEVAPQGPGQHEDAVAVVGRAAVVAAVRERELAADRRRERADRRERRRRLSSSAAAVLERRRERARDERAAGVIIINRREVAQRPPADVRRRRARPERGVEGRFRVREGQAVVPRDEALDAAAVERAGRGVAAAREDVQK